MRLRQKDLAAYLGIGLVPRDDMNLEENVHTEGRKLTPRHIAWWSIKV